MAANFGDIAFNGVSLTGSTPKTIVGFIAPANIAVKVLGYTFTANGVDATDIPIKVEICSCTFATNPPGTNSTSVNPSKNNPNMTETFQTAAAVNWTTEPTVLTAGPVLDLPAFNGSKTIQLPLLSPRIVPGGSGFAIRMTAADSVSVSGYIMIEE